jgi:hypothetical protein
MCLLDEDMLEAELALVASTGDLVDQMPQSLPLALAELSRPPCLDYLVELGGDLSHDVLLLLSELCQDILAPLDQYVLAGLEAHGLPESLGCRTVDPFALGPM